MLWECCRGVVGGVVEVLPGVVSCSCCASNVIYICVLFTAACVWLAAGAAVLR